ncbi:MAG: hypothetical protein ACPHN3_07975 [Spongiibacter sp.]
MVSANPRVIEVYLGR